MAKLACSSSRPLGKLDWFLLKNKNTPKIINTRPKRQKTLHNMEYDITEKLQTLILLKGKEKGAEHIACYLNNVETPLSNAQGCHNVTFHTSS